MTELLIALATAFWLGIVTAFAPCPMATNIAAISFLGRNLASPARVFYSGILYAIGRTLAYIGLAALLIASLLSTQTVTIFLQTYMNKILGPIMVLVGMVLLGLLSFTFSTGGAGEKVGKKLEALGLIGSLLLGVLFALSFCPVSAVLYFGSLMPLAASANSAVLVPSVYGIATALPVIFFAFVIAFSANKLSNVFNKIAVFERWARIITGVLFIGLGIWFSLKYVYEVM